ncbi:hypothetical protein CTZ27_07810 [Streptomyces griseocarneus]|nr:hypothetical protein CTZ27_07810 [Streptomyces griseocarneus]
MQARVTAAALALVTGAALLVSAQGSSVSAKAVSPTEWCGKQGGTAAAYRAYYDAGFRLTPLGTVRELCHFQAQDQTQIVIPADTLAADAPTLAGLAYKRKPALPGHPVGNPSSAYCAKLGGTTQFGESKAQTGGWIREGEPVDRDHLHTMCVFADASAIDAWGLTYHTGGIVRGADLEGKFRASIPPAAPAESWNQVR